MQAWRMGGGLALAVLMAAAASAQPSSITVDDDDITMRGCVTQTRTDGRDVDRTLAWGRKDIMLAAAGLPLPAAASRVFYWIDDDDKLARHVGQQVEITGELEDFEKGELKVERDGDFTEIELDLDGDEQKIRVPTAWLGPGAPTRDQEVDIVARRVEIKDVKILGACQTR
jgi:hypothetical protein